jgi:hypothetical protein
MYDCYCTHTINLKTTKIAAVIEKVPKITTQPTGFYVITVIIMMILGRYWGGRE